MTFKYQLTFLLAILASVALMLAVLGILIFTLGWQVLYVLGAAFVLFIAVCVGRDFLRAAARARSL